MTPEELKQAQALVFMALCVWREARSESEDCRIAVAHVIKTRADNPGWWGDDVLSVVTAPFQFSSMTDPKDPQLTTWPSGGSWNLLSWQSCLLISAEVLQGTTENPVPGATHYHDTSIGQPRAWGKNVEFLRQIGRLRFYRVG